LSVSLYVANGYVLLYHAQNMSTAADQVHEASDQTPAAVDGASIMLPGMMLQFAVLLPPHSWLCGLAPVQLLNCGVAAAHPSRNT
jgi:hypothetical protein